MCIWGESPSYNLTKIPVWVFCENSFFGILAGTFSSPSSHEELGFLPPRLLLLSCLMRAVACVCHWFHLSSWGQLSPYIDQGRSIPDGGDLWWAVPIMPNRVSPSWTKWTGPSRMEDPPLLRGGDDDPTPFFSFYLLLIGPVVFKRLELTQQALCSWVCDMLGPYGPTSWPDST